MRRRRAGGGTKRPNAAGHLNGMDYVLSLMAFASGTVDIISFTSLGGIFASAMTGNLALLGLHAAQGNLHSAFASALSLTGFALGAASATWFGYDKPIPHAVNELLGAEVVLLAIFVLFWPLAGAGRGLLSYVPIIPIATAMGVQINIAKKLDLSGVSTTVFTSSLANALISLVQSACAGRLTFSIDTTRQVRALVTYLAGALLAGLASFHHWFAIQMMPLAAILIATVLHGITSAAARQS